MRASLSRMIASLDELSSTPRNLPQEVITPTSLSHTGRRGRPRIEVNPEILETALQLRGGPTSLAPVFDCSARTLRRRALELGLVEPGPPVYVDFEHEDGSITRIYRSSTAPVSTLEDEELDIIIASILTIFPTFRRRLLDGHLKHLGHRVPQSRIQESYTRVHGAPALRFGAQRRIERRVYNVPGPNSLWHNDGQHGV